MKFSFLSVSLLIPTASGFLFFNTPDSIPGLSEIVDAQALTRLSINLDVGREGHESRLAISNMQVDLYNETPNYDHVGLPGKNGPHPKVSSGIRRLDVIDGGHFVSLQGSQNVKASKSCWEINWKEDLPAGALVCGLEILEEYQRNDAVLPQGRVYLSFPVWTNESLKSAQERKAQVFQNAKDAQKEREEELNKYKSTDNLLMKALHYRNAYAAAEREWLQPVKKYSMVPDDDEVMSLQDDLLLTTKGLLWSKTLPTGNQVLLGTATVSVKPNDSQE